MDVKIYEINQSNEIIDYFVQNGFCIIRDCADKEKINRISKFVIKTIHDLSQTDENIDYHLLSIELMDHIENTEVFVNLTESRNIIDLASLFLGNDIGLFFYNALWINAPEDENVILNKNAHNDFWTGTSINSLFMKYFLTDCDKYNGISVSPGSHLQGAIPVRNRTIDPNINVSFQTVNLDMIRNGDILIWHPLLMHSTTGHSKKNYRVSITCRYTSTETIFSSQERALGYKAIRVSPYNQILRLIGNDNLLPLRTYGGIVAIDKRMRKIYNNSTDIVEKKYDKFLSNNCL